MKKTIRFAQSSILFLSLAILCSSCETTSDSISRGIPIAQELIGHSTGGREKSRRFAPGQIQSAKLIGAETWELVVRAPTGKEFAMKVKIVRGTGGSIQSVGLLYIEQL